MSSSILSYRIEFYYTVFIFIMWLQLGMNFEALRSESAILHVFPFSSDKKRGGVAGQRVISYAVSSEIHRL